MWAFLKPTTESYFSQLSADFWPHVGLWETDFMRIIYQHDLIQKNKNILISVKSLKYVRKWPVAYFHPIMEIIFVTIATLEQYNSSLYQTLTLGLFF